MKTLIFVPARSGSKGIKNKNLIKLGNKKLIDYTLDLISELDKNFQTFVSTDSKIILNHCSKKGFQNKYLRPKNLSGDTSTIIDTIKHALEWLKLKNNNLPNIIILLQPTSPFRNIFEIKKAIKTFFNKKCSSMVGVTEMIEHPRECVIKKNKNWEFLINKQPNKKRRQDYENDYYFIDGSFYMAKTDFLIKNNSFVVENKSFLYKFSNKYSIDIDDIHDLKVAKSIASTIK